MGGPSDNSITFGALTVGAVALALVFWWSGPLGALVFGLPVALLAALVVMFVRVRRQP